jgi:hypothetical protein
VWMINASRDEAIAFAMDTALKLGRRGQCTHVCVVDDGGRFQSKWTYDRDHHLRRSAS